MVKADGGFYAVVVHFDHVGAGEGAKAVHNLHLAGLGQSGKAASQLIDNAFFPAAKFIQIDLGLGKADAVIAHFLCFGDHFGRMQKRLGRDTAHVEADTAKGAVFLNQHNFLAQICCAEGRCVAARARAQHHHFGMHITGTGCSASRGHGLWCCGYCRSCRLGRFFCALGVQNDDQAALRDIVALGHFDLFHHASGRGRHFHSGLVAFQLDQRILCGDGVANRDQNGNHGNFGKVTNIRYFDVHSEVLP